MGDRAIGKVGERGLGLGKGGAKEEVGGAREELRKRSEVGI